MLFFSEENLLGFAAPFFVDFSRSVYGCTIRVDCFSSRHLRVIWHGGAVEHGTLFEPKYAAKGSDAHQNNNVLPEYVICSNESFCRCLSLDFQTEGFCGIIYWLSSSVYYFITFRKFPPLTSSYSETHFIESHPPVNIIKRE
jgi:hypothetical protein